MVGDLQKLIFSKDAVECVTKLIGGRLRVTPKVRISTNRVPLRPYRKPLQSG